MNLADRIAGYAYRYWHRHGMTEWPSVKQTRHALQLRNADIEDCAGDGPYQLTGYNSEDVTVGICLSRLILPMSNGLGASIGCRSQPVVTVGIMKTEADFPG